MKKMKCSLLVKHETLAKKTKNHGLRPETTHLKQVKKRAHNEEDGVLVKDETSQENQKPWSQDENYTLETGTIRSTQLNEEE
jgi:hypothetical protein